MVENICRYLTNIFETISQTPIIDNKMIEIYLFYFYQQLQNYIYIYRVYFI